MNTGKFEPAMELSPNCPCSLSPQQKTLPSPVSTHVCQCPELIAEIWVPASAPVRLTATGTAEFWADPLPSCPWLLSPQHQGLPSLLNAHVCQPPALTATSRLPAASLETSTATGTADPTTVPLPNCPSLLSPQQKTFPALVNAHVCHRPELIAMTVLRANTPAMSTATGTAEPRMDALPNCPSLLAPQQKTFPALVNAHVCLPPALTDATVLPASTPLASTATGIVENALHSPLPNCPFSLLPQQKTLPSRVKAHEWFDPVLI